MSFYLEKLAEYNTSVQYGDYDFKTKIAEEDRHKKKDETNRGRTVVEEGSHWLSLTSTSVLHCGHRFTIYAENIQHYEDDLDEIRAADRELFKDLVTSGQKTATAKVNYNKLICLALL